MGVDKSRGERQRFWVEMIAKRDTGGNNERRESGEENREKEVKRKRL